MFGCHFKWQHNTGFTVPRATGVGCGVGIGTGVISGLGLVYPGMPGLG